MNALLLDPSEAQRRAIIDLHLGFEEAKCSEKLDYKALGDFDLVVGAPAMYADDVSRSQDEEFEFAIDEIRPQFFMIEMARGFSGPRFEGWTQDLVDDLADFGYDVGYTLAEVDGRKRTIVLGVRSDTGRAVTFGCPGHFTVDAIRKNLGLDTAPPMA